MAATRAAPTNWNETGLPEGPVLERLQYRIAQAGSGSTAAPMRDSLHGAATDHPVVSLFPTRTDALFGPEKAEAAPSTSPEPATELARQVAELEKRLAEERSASVQAIAAALEQGRRDERQALEQQLGAERQQAQTKILQALDEFRIEQQNYFHHVEGEVVRLALAIAARVLHREAQMDPLFLAGAVRVALDRLADSSSVVMRVPPPEVAKWKDYFRSGGNLRVQPGVLDDPTLSAGECVLITQLGTIELGVRAQLEEIEKGFFDLLDHRPAGTGQNSTPANRSSS